MVTYRVSSDSHVQTLYCYLFVLSTWFFATGLSKRGVTKAPLSIVANFSLSLLLLAFTQMATTVTKAMSTSTNADTASATAAVNKLLPTRAG